MKIKWVNTCKHLELCQHKAKLKSIITIFIKLCVSTPRGSCISAVDEVMCLPLRSVGVLEGALGSLPIFLNKERNQVDLVLPSPALSLSSDTISGCVNLYLEVEISVHQPLGGNRAKYDGISPTFHSPWTALREHSNIGCTLLFLPGAQ